MLRRLDLGASLQSDRDEASIEPFVPEKSPLRWRFVFANAGWHDPYHAAADGRRKASLYLTKWSIHDRSLLTSASTTSGGARA